MSTSNKALGTQFEKEFAEMLSKRGFYVHLLQQSKSGQPFDGIAVKNGYSFCFDCKTCSYPYLPTNRIEPNQQICMQRFNDAVGEYGYSFFACKYFNKIYIVPYSEIDMSCSSVPIHSAMTYKEWISSYEN